MRERNDGTKQPAENESREDRDRRRGCDRAELVRPGLCQVQPTHEEAVGPQPLDVQR
jgi:hypothetical protein